MKDLQIKVIAALLVIAATALVYHKNTELGLPLLPAEMNDVWTVEARISFQANGGPAKAEFYIPHKPPGFIKLNEDFISSNYGLATDYDKVNRKALWAVRRAYEKQVLYYRCEIAFDEASYQSRLQPIPSYPSRPVYGEPHGSAIGAVLEEVRAHSADTITFTRELLLKLNSPEPDENVAIINKAGIGKAEWVRQVINILAGARIPARIVYILQLQDRIKHGTLVPWLEVYDGKHWTAFNPVTASHGFTPNTLVWRVGDDPLVTIEGGQPAQVEFSIARHSRTKVSLAEQWAKQVDSKVMAFSLFTLPVHTQNVYRIILLVPLGALLIVVLRNIVGIQTFGTFMPILIALAFRETQLLWGVTMFSILVAIGLMLRLYLERLKLLLVPRLAAVLTIVILIIASISILSSQLGLDRGLSIALFPVVILAMTIERMSLIWEEHGPSEALNRGIGSLIAACLGYLVLSNETLAHLVFVFPELLLVVLAAILLLGRYTGYRLTELWRFRAVLFSNKNKTNNGDAP
ncbi:MAG: inactive transglutaminase family protein [Pseudomonadales bacterium]|nr:inactive transglutaminase family protein [Pseudomonadales bacterium]